MTDDNIAATISTEVLAEIEKLRNSDLTVEQTADQIRKAMKLAREAAHENRTRH